MLFGTPYCGHVHQKFAMLIIRTITGPHRCGGYRKLDRRSRFFYPLNIIGQYRMKRRTKTLIQGRCSKKSRVFGMSGTNVSLLRRSFAYLSVSVAHVPIKFVDWFRLPVELISWSTNKTTSWSSFPCSTAIWLSCNANQFERHLDQYQGLDDDDSDKRRESTCN